MAIDTETECHSHDSIQTAFENATERISSGVVHVPSTDTQLRLYGLYSVIHKGSQPPKEGPSSVFNPTAHAKWRAWCDAAAQHLTNEQIMQDYINIVDQLSSANESESGLRSSSSSTSSSMWGRTISTGFDIPSCNKIDNDNNDTIWGLAERGETKKLLQNLDHSNVNQLDQDGMTLLMRASDRGHEDTVCALLKLGAKTEIQDGDGLTALHYAVVCGHSKTVEILLCYGADKDIKDIDMKTPMQMAEAQRNENPIVFNVMKAPSMKTTITKTLDLNLIYLIFAFVFICIAVLVGYYYR